MKLCPREQENLLIHQAGYVAQKRLARGCKLNHPEAVALISCQLLEFIRNGETVADLMNKGKQLLGQRQVMNGVADMIKEVQVEGTFPDGTKMVTVSYPICREDGNLSFALYGSFLPIPDTNVFQKEETEYEKETKGIIPGCYYPKEGDEKIHINKDRKRIALKVASSCDRPIQVGSHYHFIELNKRLIFDRAQSYGMRLDIPSGSAVRFEPGESKIVTLVEIGGAKKIYGGNNLCDGPMLSSNLPNIMKKIKNLGFGNKKQDTFLPVDSYLLSRYNYMNMYGPTVGDKVRLGDMNLIIEIERDFTVYGDECTFGGGKVIRDGMGQAALLGARDVLDTVITNCVIIDAKLGILKADIGIKVSKIKFYFICFRMINYSTLYIIVLLIPIKTLLIQCRFIMEATDDFPLNFGFTGKGNTTDTQNLSKGLVEQIEAGAVGFKVHEDYGSTPSAIDSALKVADAFDVQITIHSDTLNESACVEETIEAFKGRTIHTYHSEGAGGGHAPDILRVCSEPNVIPSSTAPTKPFTKNTIDEFLDMLLVCHNLDKNNKEDLLITESRIRGETMASEDILHDMGAMSIMSSDAQASGRMAEVLIRTWQTADKMKKVRGPLPEDSTNNDNFRVKRYIAKYTINPAIAHGLSHVIGSIEVGKMADLVLWKPAFFGVKPDMIIKGGDVAWSDMGLPSGSIPTVEPIIQREMYGAHGHAPKRNSCVFVSKASLEKKIVQKYSIGKTPIAIENCRKIGKADMVLNDTLPKLKVDPETFKVYAAENRNGKKVWSHLTCEPSEVLPLAQKYYLF
nr:urease subunit alpha [Parasteatoda tepidariorum]